MSVTSVSILTLPIWVRLPSLFCLTNFISRFRKVLNIPFWFAVNLLLTFFIFSPQVYHIVFYWQFFFEAASRNKLLKAGSLMLYQVFPGNHINWHRQCIKSIKENEVDTVKNMITFFKTQPSFINAKETNSGNTALHWACRTGCYVSGFIYMLVYSSVSIYCIISLLLLLSDSLLSYMLFRVSNKKLL